MTIICHQHSLIRWLKIFWVNILIQNHFNSVMIPYYATFHYMHAYPNMKALRFEHPKLTIHSFQYSLRKCFSIFWVDILIQNHLSRVMIPQYAKFHWVHTYLRMTPSDLAIQKSLYFTFNTRSVSGLVFFELIFWFKITWAESYWITWVLKKKYGHYGWSNQRASILGKVCR